MEQNEKRTPSEILRDLRKNFIFNITMPRGSSRLLWWGKILGITQAIDQLEGREPQILTEFLKERSLSLSHEFMSQYPVSSFPWELLPQAIYILLENYEVYCTTWKKEENALIQWRCYERMGSPIRSVNLVDGEYLIDEQANIGRNDLYAGMLIAAPSLFEGAHVLTVVQEGGNFYGQKTPEAKQFCILSYDEEYEEWVSLGFANLEGLKRISLSSE